MSTVSIRSIQDRDTSLIVRWRNLDTVRSKFIFQEKFTEALHRNWMKTKVKTGDAVQFIIELDGRPVGSVYLRDIDTYNKKAEFGIFIGEDYARGYGVGKEATRQIIEYAFNHLNLNKIFLRVFEENVVAISCYKNVGFKYEGCAREDVIVNGEKRNIIFMSMLKEEWSKNND